MRLRSGINRRPERQHAADGVEEVSAAKGFLPTTDDPARQQIDPSFRDALKSLLKAIA
jgi:hypothetical protein